MNYLLAKGRFPFPTLCQADRPRNTNVTGVERVILQVDAYFSQVIVDHGLQLCNIWSSSPDCDVSVANPLDRWDRPWHISYVIVEQGR